MDLFDWAEQHGCRADAPAPQLPCTVPADPTPEAIAIRRVLAQCIGKENRATAPTIAARAGLWPNLRPADRGTRAREVIRTWLEYMRLEGHMLIAGSEGYWHTSDPDEMTKYCSTLRSRALGNFSRLRRSRAIGRLVPGVKYVGQGRFVREEVMPAT